MANCPSCAAQIEPGGDLCLECGADLTVPERAAPPPIPGASKVKAAAPPSRPTIAAAPKAMKRREPDEESVRCPGCGSPSKAARCPGCGAILKRDS